MILIIVLVFLFRQYGTSAAPVVMSFPDPSAYDMGLFARNDPHDEIPGRSVWDIAWSCLATTLAVTWVSVHPNIPWLKERSVHLLKRRIFLMCLALLAPEVMIMWAFKQWRGALLIKEAFNEARPKSYRPWTMTHAHFFQMGGFKLRKLDRFDDRHLKLYAYRTSSDEDEEEWESVPTFHIFKILLVSGEITCPDITEEEIEDRSKSNAVSKGVVLLQISWFLIQLIARAHQHLAITEIELTTAALAGMNSIMYLFWWSKPFGVRCPIVIRTKELERRFAGAGEEVGDAEGTVEQTEWSFPVDEDDRLTEDFDVTSHPMGQVRSTICTLRDRVSGTQVEQTLSPIRAALASHNDAENPAARRCLKWIWTCCKSAVTKLFVLLNLLMSMPFSAILGVGWYVNLSSFSDAKDKIDNEPSLQLLFNNWDMKWIMGMIFYSEKSERTPLLIFSALAGAAFGSIHCAAWNFDFPSHAEKILWRTASLTVVGVCLSIIVGIPSYKMVNRKMTLTWNEACDRYDNDQSLPISERQGVKRQEEDAKYRMWLFMQRSLETIPAIIYPLARLSLLALALSSLRDLRGSALETVTWTKFIPHI